MLVLLDMGANVNMITPGCMVALGLQMGPLMDLCKGGITIDQPFNYEGRPIGYVIMSVQIDGYPATMRTKLHSWPVVPLSLCTMFPSYWGHPLWIK